MVQEQCALTCGLCSSPSPSLPSPSPPSPSPPPPPSPAPSSASPCADHDPEFCQREVTQVNELVTKCKAPHFASTCRLSCGFCAMSPPPPPSPSQPACRDTDPEFCQRELT